MATKGKNSSVHDEQFGNIQNNAENTEDKITKVVSSPQDNEALTESEEKQNKTGSKDVTTKSAHPEVPDEGEKNEESGKEVMQESEDSGASAKKMTDTMKGSEEKKETKKEKAEDVAKPVSETEKNKLRKITNKRIQNL